MRGERFAVLSTATSVVNKQLVDGQLDHEPASSRLPQTITINKQLVDHTSPSSILSHFSFSRPQLKQAPFTPRWSSFSVRLSLSLSAPQPSSALQSLMAPGLSVKATSVFDEVYVVKSGEVFDGGMKTYDRSDIICLGQTESNVSTAVFEVQPGATLKNVIIGTNQMEGVHCEMSGCTIENVWWEDVCEDALSIKGGNTSSVSRVIGGGARYADDKVIQHNGYGTVTVDGFFVQDFGKLYRSCGNCRNNPLQRFLNVSNVYADLSVIKTHGGE